MSEWTDAPSPPGRQPIIAVLTDNDLRNGTPWDEAVGVHIRNQQKRIGSLWRRLILRIYGAELDRLANLRTRLLYATLEPWGA